MQKYKSTLTVVGLLFFSLLLAPLGAGATEAVEESVNEPTVADILSADPTRSVPAQKIQEKSMTDSEPGLSLPGIRLLNTSHGFFSKNIEILSDRVDSIFGDDRIFEETGGTYVQVRGSAIYSKYGELTFDSRIRAKVKFDNLTDTVQLILSGDEDSADPDTVISGTELEETFDDRDPEASLQFRLLEQARWDVRLRPGLKFRAPIDPFFKLRFRREQKVWGKWLWRTTLYPAWYNSRGYEVPVSTDLERGTGRGGFFRSSSRVTWREEDPANLLLQETLLFSHPWGRRNQFAYTAGVGFEREPRWRDSIYFATIRFRRNIHRGWIFFEVTPQLLFTRSSDFKAEPSLALTLELFFGGSYLK
jgi:hypothetical protein